MKQALFAIVIGLLFLPMLQHKFEFAFIKPLDGAVTKQEFEKITFGSWLSGEFQNKTDLYLKDHFGFRDDVIRLNNQLKFSLFKLAKANGVIVGKDNYLYELDYIRAYRGLDYLGSDSIKAKIHKLALIKDKLKAKEKQIIVILAPGKASFFPEFIPDRFDHSDSTNYKTYVKFLSQYNINTIDFNIWFRRMKSKSKYPLYPKCGIHWSKYGEFLAADSILNYLERHTNRQFPELVLDSIIVNEENSKEDYDIGAGMNLYLPIETYPMAYPQYHFEKDTILNSPKVLVVSDSYYWGMFNNMMSHYAFNGGQFWYYNNEIYPDHYYSPTRVADIDIVKEVESNDVILLVVTDANLHSFAFGFIERLHEAYSNK